MKKIADVSENEVILLFLQSELASKRWGNKLKKLLFKDGQTDRVILLPNVDNAAENRYRKNLMGRFRGYGQNKDLFEGFPPNMRWYRYSLSPAELNKVKFINYSYWHRLSKGTRLPKIAAETVNKGIVIFREPNHNFLEAAEALDKGHRFPLVILVGKDEQSTLVVLEGHVRLTAFSMRPGSIGENLEVIMGFSKDIGKWSLY